MLHPRSTDQLLLRQQHSHDSDYSPTSTEHSTTHSEQHHQPQNLNEHPPNSLQLSHTLPAISFEPPSADLSHPEFGFDNHNQDHRYISQFRPILNQNSSSSISTKTCCRLLLPIIISRSTRFLLTISLPKSQRNLVYGSICPLISPTSSSSYSVDSYRHVRDFFGKRFKSTDFKHLMPQNGYAALNSDFDSFYTRRLKARMDDCFARPVTGVAGRTINLIERVTFNHCKSFYYTNQIVQTLNISSYNYLGFAQSKGYVTDHVHHSLETQSVAVGGSREDVGTLTAHIRCEKLISQFLGVQETILISQGFATNSTTFPIRIQIIGGMVRQYKHNDMIDLNKLLRESISQGQPRTHRPWKKIIVVVEGIYSMEGTIVNLPALYALKAIYKYTQSSLSSACPNGKGVCDYYGLDPQGIDIMMGTLTKSFGASGGYIAGNSSIIQPLRSKNHSSVYGESMSPPVIQQIISSLTLIAGLEEQESTTVVEQDLSSDLYLSSGLRKLGFIVYGDRDSPIIPLLIFHPGKMLQFSRMMLERYAIVVVVVAYPATPLVSSRVRFCVSASHTKTDIDKILIATDQIGQLLGLKMSNGTVDTGFNGRQSDADPPLNVDGKQRWTIQQVLDNSLLLVHA
ncbi:hypothetical protein H4Q26_006168 [Puccinia striiformis f. sp. tritici PST-130]|nr:hypothetical protein H4Q26_006168 [Puccinia striiformis f. sp. tritici PST-130]